MVLLKRVGDRLGVRVRVRVGVRVKGLLLFLYEIIN
jgi:hypothetical protein